MGGSSVSVTPLEVQEAVGQTSPPRTFAQQLYASSMIELFSKNVPMKVRVTDTSGSNDSREVYRSSLNNHRQDRVQPNSRLLPTCTTFPDIASPDLYSHATPKQLISNRQMVVLPTCPPVGQPDRAEEVLTHCSTLNSSQPQSATRWEAHVQQGINAPILGVMNKRPNPISTIPNSMENSQKSRSTLKKKPPSSHFLKRQQPSGNSHLDSRASIRAYYPSTSTTNSNNPHIGSSFEREGLCESPPSHGHDYNLPLYAVGPQVDFLDVSSISTNHRPLAVTPGMMINQHARMVLVHDHNQQAHGGHHAVGHQYRSDNVAPDNIEITTETILSGENVLSGSMSIATASHCLPYLLPCNGRNDVGSTFVGDMSGVAISTGSHTFDAAIEVVTDRSLVATEYWDDYGASNGPPAYTQRESSLTQMRDHK